MIALLTVPILSIGIVLGGKFGGPRLQEASMTQELEEDLPCPWCFAQTTEQDPTCPSCGRRFGSPHGGDSNTPGR